MNNLRSSPPNTSIQDAKTVTGALRTAWIIFGASAVLVLFYIFLSWQLKAWQMVSLTALIALYGASALVSIRYIHNDRPFTGLWIIIIGMYVVFPIAALLIADVGIIFALVCILLVFAVSRNLPAKQPQQALYVGIAVALPTALFDYLGLTYRLTVPIIQTVVPAITGVIILAMGFFFIRQSWSGNLRTKLIIAFLGATIIPLALLALINNNNTQKALTDDADQALFSAASLTAAQLDTFMTNGLDAIRTEANLPDVINYLISSPSQRAEQNDEIIPLLSTFARQNPIYITSVAIYDKKGIDVADTYLSDIGTNKSDRDYFKQVMANGVPYASDVEFSETTGEASIYFAAPVRNLAGDITGLIRTRYNAAILQDFMATNKGLAGTTSFPVLLNKDHFRLGHGTSPELIFKSIVPLDAKLVKELQTQRRLPPGTPEELSTNLPDFEAGVENAHAQKFFVAELKINDNTLEQAALAGMKTQPWEIVYAESQEEFLAPINAQARTGVLFTIGISVVVALFGLFMAQTLAGPITRLTQTAEAIAGGDINIQAKVETGDEIGTLASTFNRMTLQLRELISSLEQRVQERTAKMERRNLDLALAAEVGQTVSQVREINEMLKDAAEIMRAFFGLYYVQVYLVSPDQKELVLQFGTGKVGEQLVSRGHRLPLDENSINGRAALAKRSVVIADTATNPAFRPNPLLPNTRSELAVPLLVGDTLIGVMDVQSEKVNQLNEEALLAFEPMSGQMAVAIQNSRLVTETQRARAEVEALVRRLTHQGWTEYLDAVHKPEQIGFAFTNNSISPLTGTEKINATDLSVPISVTGEMLGTLVVELDQEKRDARTEELVNTVARQVAQQIESLRLLESAERYRAEIEETSRRATREGWQSFVASAETKLNYFYDLNEVRAVDGSPLKQEETTAVPLKVRDEVIGGLAIQGFDSSNTESVELVNAVAERLSAHIEALRQFEQTQSALEQTSKLSEAGLQFSQATDLQELLGVVNRTLGISGVNRILLGVINYNSNNELDSLDIVANWWSGSGHQPSEIGRHYTPENLNILPIFLSATPVFFNNTFTDERINESSMITFTSQNIHALAVLPLYIGAKQIGVLFLESEDTHNFTQSQISLFSAMAPQLATVLENRLQFQRARQQAERESMLNLIGQKIQTATTVEAVLQIAARELGHALGTPMTVAQLSMKDQE